MVINPSNEPKLKISLVGKSVSKIDTKFKEYIVKFERFLDKPTRRRELAEFMSAFAGSCNSGYVVLEKNRLFDALPSDFDVIRVKRTQIHAN